jgi:hypothetical protein
MGRELTLRHASGDQLQHDFDANLRKGRAFVPGPSLLAERDYCTLCIEAPSGGAPHRVRAEAVWIDAAGTGLSFIDFDAASQSALRAFVEAAASPSAAESAPAAAEGQPDAGLEPEARPSPESSASNRNLHERVRALDLAQRDVMAREGSMPERVALERCYGSSVWEGLLHNPQLTPREVRSMATSTSLPAALLTLVTANRAWVADAGINQALLSNPRLSGPQLERVLKVLSQADLARLAEQSSVRLQVRQGAKRLIRR